MLWCGCGVTTQRFKKVVLWTELGKGWPLCATIWSLQCLSKRVSCNKHALQTCITTDDASERLTNRIDDTSTKCYDFVVTQEDIYNRLARLKTDKSPGPDQLHPRILYETRDVIAYPLFLIFSKSLETGRLPGDWKLAEVTAIYKKGPSMIEVITDQSV